MSHNDWRNLKWSSMGINQKVWFILLILSLFVLLIAIYLDTTGTLDIPNWAALLWIVVSGYIVYRNVENLDLFEDDDNNGEK